jgi:hypothetical protein
MDFGRIDVDSRRITPAPFFYLYSNSTGDPRIFICQPDVFYIAICGTNDILSSLMQKTITEIMRELGHRCRELRLAKNLSRAGLSTRSGVSISVIRLFETTGKISLESLIKLAIPLDAIDDFECLFQAKQPDTLSLDELLKLDKKRLRGRQS